MNLRGECPFDSPLLRNVQKRNINGATFSSSGRSGGAYFFDGTNDRIVVPSDPALNESNHFSLSAFFKANNR
jgi:hypothetical protein